MWQQLRNWLGRGLPGSGSDAAEPAATADYPRIYRQLTPDRLHADSEELTEEAILEDLYRPRSRGHHFLGFYSKEGGHLAMERYGFFKLLRDKGFDPRIGGDFSDTRRQQLRIYDGVDDPEHQLIRLEAGFRDLELPHGEDCRMLFIHWLMMQNPRRELASGRPPLPDQDHPGLGLFLYFGHLLRLMAVRLHCDGLMNHPAHFHNAVLYGKVMRFVDPQAEGRFQALRRDLAGLDLANATRAVDDGRVLDASGEPLRWQGVPQVMPITLQVHTWFDSPEYRDAVAAATESERFTVAGADGPSDAE